MTLGVLFPSDPLRPRHVDPHVAPEADVAMDAGAPTGVVDHDALLAGDAAAAVRRVPPDIGPVWYRGWMIPSDRYADLAAALGRRGVPLVVPPADYRAAHELPGWYRVFATVTPRSVWRKLPPATLPAPAELAELVAPLGGGPAIVKDYVKSRKDEWATACYVPDVADTVALHRVVTNLVELQGDDLAGGIVVREFESFRSPAHGAGALQARVWWLDGAPVLVGPHPDTPDEPVSPDLDGLAPLVAALGCRFVTTDLAARDDGVWRVVEVGDGQVSDRPASIAAARLVAVLTGAPATRPPTPRHNFAATSLTNSCSTRRP
jgi:ATP-grasp domain, R2K clade family 3